MELIGIRNFLLSGLFMGVLIAPLGAQEESPLIEGASIFQDGEWKEGRDLYVKNGKIQKIEKSSSEPPSKAEEKFLLPPIVNAHIHLWKPDALKSALGHGIFALLDMHTSDEIAQRLRAYNDSLRYASFHSSNAGATVPKGHGTQFGIEVPTIDSSTDPESFVMNRIEAGADYIKILREPSMPTLDFEQTKRIIEVAHREDMRVIAHVSRKDDAVKLVQQGVDGLAHVWHDEPIGQEELERMAEKDVFVIPTLIVIERMMKASEEKERQERMNFEDVQKEVHRLHKAGIPILIGTDPPNAGIDYTDDLFTEMSLLHEAGLSKKAVLSAATENVHSHFKSLSYGLAPEKNASFLLLNEKPDEEFKIEENLEKVYKKGRPLKPDSLLKEANGKRKGAKAGQELNQGKLSLEVKMDSLRSKDGQILLSLKNGDQKKLASKRHDIEEKPSKVRFEGLQKGQYAISVIHDENGNGKFDMDNRSIPEEGWGYSNNVKGNMGPPPFEDQLLNLNSDSTITIHMNYYGE